MAEEIIENEWDIVRTDKIEWEGDRINHYVIGKHLGSGSFGVVKRCTREVGEPPYREFALKFLSKSKLRKSKDTVLDEDGFPCRINGLEKLYNEIGLMQHLFHRNVSILFEAMDDPDEDSVILVTEFMQGGAVMSFNTVTGCFEYSVTAADIMGGRGRQKDAAGVDPELALPNAPTRSITDEEAVSFFHDLLKGLEYLHSKGICHRDIKPHNLLVHESGSLRISDFGCAKNFNLASNPLALVSNTVGTIAFWPPEAIAPSLLMEHESDPDGQPPPLPLDDIIDLDPPEVTEYSALAADAWAAALTLHCLLYGTLPFPIRGVGPLDIMRSIATFDPDATSKGISVATGPTEYDDDCGGGSHYIDYELRGDHINTVWRKMLQPAPPKDGDECTERRWGISQALNSEWIRNEVRRRIETGQDGPT